jgi:hypothetical protein
MVTERALLTMPLGKRTQLIGGQLLQVLGIGTEEERMFETCGDPLPPCSNYRPCGRKPVPTFSAWTPKTGVAPIAFRLARSSRSELPVLQVKR